MARPRKDQSPSTAPNRQRLSHFAIKNLQPRERPYTIWDIVQRGLAVSVQPSGHAAWKTIYSHHGRPRWIHLADVTAIGLAKARELAADVMYQVAKGQDPAAERRAERSTGTFEDLANGYRKYAERKNKSWKQSDKLIKRYLLPKWAKLSAASIARADVKHLLASIDAPILSNQVLASASAVFSWAIREEAGGVKLNPCIGIERNATTSRERILSDGEVSLFWSAFEAAGLEGAALKAILLLGQRPGEVANMRTEHIDGDWWSMPGDPVESLNWPGTKNAQSHRVFLPAQAKEIIAGMGTKGMVFAGVTNDQIAKAMRLICKALKVARCTPHDLRRSHGTVITSLGFGRDAMNRVQNHREGGIADVYDQHQYAEENKKIMQAVADRFMQLANGDGPANVVVPFKAKISA